MIQKLYKTFLLGLDILKLNFGALKSPFKLNLVITKNCNSKCLNCDIWKVVPENEISLDEIQSIARNMPTLKWLEITGGEPTLRKDLQQIVQSFYDACPDLLFVHFPTNAILPEKVEKVCREVRAIGNFNLYVTVSLDGPKDINDQLRGVKGNFERSIDTYKRLKDIAGVKVYFGMTLFKSNYQRIEDAYREISAQIPGFKRSDLHINLGHYSAHYYGNNNSEDIHHSFEILEQIKKYYSFQPPQFTAFHFVDVIYRKFLNRYIRYGKSPLPCQSLKASVYVSEKGDLYPCSMWAYKVGSLRENQYDLKALQASPRYQQAIELIQQEKCSHCWTPCEAYQTIMGNLKKLPF